LLRAFPEKDPRGETRKRDITRHFFAPSAQKINQQQPLSLTCTAIINHLRAKLAPRGTTEGKKP